MQLLCQFPYPSRIITDLQCAFYRHTSVVLSVLKSETCIWTGSRIPAAMVGKVLSVDHHARKWSRRLHSCFAICIICLLLYSE